MKQENAKQILQELKASVLTADTAPDILHHDRHVRWEEDTPAVRHVLPGRSHRHSYTDHYCDVRR